ncbi:formylglycine-generating enzyme family protein, partial [Fusobacterium periodonticum]
AIEQGTFNYTYSGSNNIDEVAWYIENSGETYNVGLKKPNQLGLYDCTGNVWEWCYDTTENIEEGKNYIYKAFDASNKSRRLKGGSWNDISKFCAVLNREINQATDALYFIGFRIVRTV